MVWEGLQVVLRWPLAQCSDHPHSNMVSIKARPAVTSAH
jgi:hypothetical protein